MHKNVSYILEQKQTQTYIYIHGTPTIYPKKILLPSSSYAQYIYRN